jgi:phenylacetate-coenzyme A ligase PaaK-like adenylate-forming protein
MYHNLISFALTNGTTRYLLSGQTVTTSVRVGNINFTSHERRVDSFNSQLILSSLFSVLNFKKSLKIQKNKLNVDLWLFCQQK